MQGPLLEAALHHAAAVLVSADLFALAHTGFKNKLGNFRARLGALSVRVGRPFGRTEGNEDRLDHVVSVGVRRKLHHLVAKDFGQQLYLGAQGVQVLADHF